MPEPQYPGKTILEEKIELLFEEIQHDSTKVQMSTYKQEKKALP